MNGGAQSQEQSRRPARAALSAWSPRLEREWRTVDAMIRLYCRERHGSRGRTLCPACAGLAAYARFRLEKCPFKSDKPTCAKCPVHCYRAKADERERMREVMRYAGPRMMLHHPLLALRHMLDSRRKVPELSRLRRPPVKRNSGVGDSMPAR